MNILVSTDIHDTAIPWIQFPDQVNRRVLQFNIKAFNEAHQEGDVLIGNSGSSLKVFDDAKEWHQQIPFQWFISDNGSRIYQKGDGGKFVLLNQWTELLKEKYNWSIETLNQAIRDQLEKAEFTEVSTEQMPQAFGKDNLCYKRGLIPYAPRLNRLFHTNVFAELDPTSKTFAFQTEHHGKAWQAYYQLPLMRQLSKLIIKRLRKKLNNSRIKIIEQRHKNRDVFIVDHLDIGKKAGLQFLIKRLNPKAVVTLDDNNNGIDQLEEPTYQNAEGEEIPNYAIVTGDNIDFDAVKAKNPRTVKTQQHGDIGQALTQQRRCAGAECNILRKNRGDAA